MYVNRCSKSRMSRRSCKLPTPGTRRRRSPTGKRRCGALGRRCKRCATRANKNWPTQEICSSSSTWCALSSCGWTTCLVKWTPRRNPGKLLVVDTLWSVLCRIHCLWHQHFWERQWHTHPKSLNGVPVACIRNKLTYLNASSISWQSFILIDNRVFQEPFVRVLNYLNCCCKIFSLKEVLLFLKGIFNYILLTRLQWTNIVLNRLPLKWLSLC